VIRQIPKKLLKHNLVYNEYLQDAGEGVSFGADITLSNVRVQEQKLVSRSLDGNEIIGNAIMFYDIVNSNGLVNKPVNSSKITFNSKVYHIVDTDILYAEKETPHHYEILLK